MVLNSLGVEALLARLVVEDLGNNDLWRNVVAVLVGVMRIAICCITFWPRSAISGICEASRIEKGMQVVDSCVDVADLNARAGSRPAASGSPSVRRVDDFVALAQVRMVSALYSALCTIGAAAILASGVPLSCTATALSATSCSPVTLALGAFVRNQRLNSLRF